LSKLCSRCGYKNEELKLSDRKLVCPKCRAEHDRDINAVKEFVKKRALGIDYPKLMPVERQSVPVKWKASHFSERRKSP